MSAISKAQIGAIHALKAKAGLDDESYRAFLTRETGQSSSTLLSGDQAGKVIVQLKVLSGEAQGGAEADFDGPYGPIARALWISGYHLGVIRQREDTALLAFVRQQTGIDHINWVRDARSGSAVVEALKAMLARDAGVIWPSGKGDTPGARKYAVIAAQVAILGLPIPSMGQNRDWLIERLGRQVRALKRKAAGQ